VLSLSQASDGKHIVLQVAIRRSDDMGGATFWIGAGTVEITAVKKTE